MMKNVLLVLLMVGLLPQAYAKEVTFSFDVLSSGPDIHPCNVGIRHKKRGDVAERTVGENIDIRTNDSRESGWISGDQLPDSITVSYGDWDGWASSNQQTKYIRNNYNNNYATLFGDDDLDISSLNATEGKIIDDLTFQLASERYGSEYFVDICYRRPDFNFDGVPRLNWVAKAWASLTDHVGSAYNYNSLSGVAVKATVFCTTGDNEDNTFKVSSSESPMVGSFASLLNQEINGTPNRCIIRFWFNEQNVNEERRYQVHGAEIKVRASISEPQEYVE